MIFYDFYNIMNRTEWLLHDGIEGKVEPRKMGIGNRELEAGEMT